jgi:hypothetical protein
VVSQGLRNKLRNPKLTKISDNRKEITNTVILGRYNLSNDEYGSHIDELIYNYF